MELLTELDRLLRAGRTRAAVDAIGDSYLPCPWTANALAVGHLRLGNTVRALRLLRHIATDDTGRLRPDVPSVFKTNLAAALLLAGDADGCLRALDEIGDEDHPAVRRLRAAAAAWVPRTAWGRWLRRLGIGPSRPPTLDGPVGELSEGQGEPGGRDGPPFDRPDATGDGIPVRPGGCPGGATPARPDTRTRPSLTGSYRDHHTASGSPV